MRLLAKLNEVESQLYNIKYVNKAGLFNNVMHLATMALLKEAAGWMILMNRLLIC